MADARRALRPTTPPAPAAPRSFNRSAGRFFVILRSPVVPELDTTASQVILNELD